MKKSQRLRLAALEAQATRTATEQAELAFLKLLASAHPDSSKDENDTDPRGLLAAAIHRFTVATSDKQRLADEAAALRQRAETAESGHVGTVTLAAVLIAAGLKAEDLKGKTAAEILTALRPATAETATGTAGNGATATINVAEHQAAQAQLGSLTAALGLTAAQLAVTPENLAKFGLKDDDEFKKLTAAQQQEKLARAVVDQAISNRTVAQIRELGIDAGNLPKPATAGTAAASLEEIQGELAACKDPVQAGILAQKANALRDQARAASAARN